MNIFKELENKIDRISNSSGGTHSLEKKFMHSTALYNNRIFEIRETLRESYDFNINTLQIGRASCRERV